MTALRLSLALAGAVTTLLLGATAGGAFAGSDPPAQSSRGRVAGEVPIGDALEVSGQPMRLSIFHTADRPSRVVAFYAEAFRARGLLPVLSGLDALAHVAVFDPGDGLQRFISAVAQPDGQTLVVTGTADPRHPPLLLGDGRTSLPIPSEHRSYFGFRSDDGPAHAESAQFLSALPVGEVARFYRQALARDGYVENGGGGDGLLLFGKTGGNLAVALQQLSAARGSAVFVTRIDGDAR
jgi:hypothetical protein